MRKYPTSLQDFEGIINDGYVYVDKTMYIHKMSESGKYYFLSRPRRFGKSMMTTTMQALYKGKKHLFEGLYIYDKWDWETTYPTIRISFADIDFETKGITEALKNTIKEEAAKFGHDLKQTELASMFREMLQNIGSQNNRVVLLIDEYDKPINHYLGIDFNKAEENRDILKNFFSILKDADPYLRLVFITGVSKYAKVSIFSDLNNVVDLTMDHRYAGICGISEEEIAQNFPEELKEIDAAKLKQWYNGYSWDLKTWVYNPFSLIKFMDSRQYVNYWFESGTPTFLIKLLKERNQFLFHNIEVNQLQLASYDLKNLNTIALMFQTGYLTLNTYDEVSDTYMLKFPNMEVEKSFNEMLLDDYANTNDDQSGSSIVANLRRAFVEGNLDKVKDLLNAIYKTIPYTLWEKHHEAYFHSILHLTFSLLSFQIKSEVMLSDARVDSIVEIADKVYCIEVKLDGSAAKAIDQIIEKGYTTQYKNSGKKIIAIGVNFSRKEKQISEFLHRDL